MIHRARQRYEGHFSIHLPTDAQVMQYPANGCLCAVIQDAAAIRDLRSHLEQQSKAATASTAAAEQQASHAATAQAAFAAATQELSSLQQERSQVAERWQATTEGIARCVTPVLCCAAVPCPVVCSVEDHLSMFLRVRNLLRKLLYAKQEHSSKTCVNITVRSNLIWQRQAQVSLRCICFAVLCV